MKKWQGLWGMLMLSVAFVFVVAGCFGSPQDPATDSSRTAAPANPPAAVGAEHPAGGDHPATAPQDSAAAPASRPAASEHPEHPGGDHPGGR